MLSPGLLILPPALPAPGGARGGCGSLRPGCPRARVCVCARLWGSRPAG